ncbi:DNA repair protein RecO [Urechidicola vernalis]|uniref:DNA repair protein RecO n=1 Tax=Urechidicola vernalis TaxID=3075600 RepID=A0ABU2Y752_9FLAO|nr:DNA repair protein RecO [Urechidicola sp. P050]MDT0553605.1 DNA repair protein RecO [Urechidicola sp. P050]
MLVATKAIVLNSIKYGDTSLIVKCFTEKSGCKSYLLKGVLGSRKGKIKASYFQPLTQLNIIGKHNSKGNLNSLKEVHIHNPYQSLYSNIFKQSIVFFLSEVLSTSIQEEESNEDLYSYIESALMWLDLHENISNFHLLFLLKLTKFLGFYPELENIGYSNFDLLEGRFVKNVKYHNNVVSNEDLIAFKKLLGINIDALHKVEFNAVNRHRVLDILIRYFELHLTGFKRPKSLDVLRQVFS